jgi:hypothetical protein
MHKYSPFRECELRDFKIVDDCASKIIDTGILANGESLEGININANFQSGPGVDPESLWRDYGAASNPAISTIRNRIPPNIRWGVGDPFGLKISNKKRILIKRTHFQISSL